jgi:glycosyltransferase involved in cell wall biosynthesis
VIARLNMGGPSYQVGLLSGRRMDPERYETLLVHGRLAAGEESMAEFAEREGARSRFLPTMTQPVSPASDARALAELGAIAREFRPHIVHTHAAKAGFLGRTTALLAVRPRPIIVHTFHGHVLEGYFGRARTTLYRSVESALARRTDRLIGVSQATVDDLVRLGVAPRERFRVVPLGLDLDRFASLAAEPSGPLRGELGLADDELLATYVGRVVPIKRLDVLLRAVATARGGGSPVQLAVVGDGEIRPDLERLAGELRIASHVHFLGYRRDLAAIAEASDLYVLSSDNEGTPVSLIEAGAAARPAVTTAVGGVPEVVTPETGILVPRGDDRALAGAIAELATDGKWRLRLGRAARDRVLGRYSAGRLVADVDALYRELLESRRSP